MDCIRNDDSASLHFRWYGSADPEGTLPKGQQEANPRVADVQSGQVKMQYSCVAYGYGGRATSAYLADTHKLSSSTFASDHYCHPSLGATKGAALLPQTAPPSGLTPAPAGFKLGLFFATDAVHPAQSIVQVLATDQFDKTSPKSYALNISYTVSRFEDAKRGRLDRVVIRLLFPGAAKSAEPFYDRAYPDGVVRPFERPTAATSRLEGDIFLPMESNNGWHLASAVLQFADLDRRQLGAVLVPLLAPGR